MITLGFHILELGKHRIHRVIDRSHCQVPIHLKCVIILIIMSYNVPFRRSINFSSKPSPIFLSEQFRTLLCT
uniref:Uncharacterized protein n=1 Tax=Arundo donax TaxID=35708 RepID=A0A0A9CET8_ARUDO